MYVLIQTSLWLQKLPKEPVPREQSSGNQRRLGIDLYDQLTNSRQTRFHAAQLFHRYFLLPDKVKIWREAYKDEHPEQEPCESHDDSDRKRGVWDLAVACMALGVKVQTILFFLRQTNSIVVSCIVTASHLSVRCMLPSFSTWHPIQ